MSATADELAIVRKHKFPDVPTILGSYDEVPTPVTHVSFGMEPPQMFSRTLNRELWLTFDYPDTAAAGFSREAVIRRSVTASLVVGRDVPAWRYRCLRLAFRFLNWNLAKVAHRA